MNRKVQRLFKWLQQLLSIKINAPDYRLGFRMLLIVLGPLAIGSMVDQPKLIGVAIFAAYINAVGSSDSTYRRQVATSVALALNATLILFVVNMISSHVVLAIATTFAVIFLLGLLGLYGAAANRVGVVSSVMFIVSLAEFSSFSTPSSLLEHCLICLAGGLWAVLVSLCLKALYPYKPTFPAAANCYSSLSKLVQLAKSELPHSEDEEAWRRQLFQMQNETTQAIAAARNSWTSVWVNEGPNSATGQRLLGLIEDADRLSSILVALLELLIVVVRSPIYQHLQAPIERAMGEVGATLTLLADTVRSDRGSISLANLDSSIAAVEQQCNCLRQLQEREQTATQGCEPPDSIHLKKISASLNSLLMQIHADVELGLALNSTPIELKTSVPTQSYLPNWFKTLRKNFTFKSLLFQHALRLAIVVTFAQSLTYILPGSLNDWIALTVITAMKPDINSTAKRTRRRVLGIIAGSIIGMATVLLINNPIAIALLTLLLMFSGIAMRSINYSVFIALFTPVIIILVNKVESQGWQAGFVLIADSLVGGVLVLLCIYLLFPNWKGEKIPALLQKTIQANLEYFQMVTRPNRGGDEVAFERSLAQARHLANLENVDTEAAIQMLSDQPQRRRGDFEPVITLMLYIRNFFSSATALSEHLKKSSAEDCLAQAKPLTQGIEQVLEDLAQALSDRRKPQPQPPLDDYIADVRDRLKALPTAPQFAQTSERSEPSIVTASPLPMADQQPLAATELDRIVRAVKTMHQALRRMQPEI